MPRRGFNLTSEAEAPERMPTEETRPGARKSFIPVGVKAELRCSIEDDSEMPTRVVVHAGGRTVEYEPSAKVKRVDPWSGG